MAFLRVEKKKSGTYLRIVESYRKEGRPKHRTLHSLGKVEDYPAKQLESIAKKLLELSGLKMEDIVAKSFHETNRYNYGYALVIQKLWKIFDMAKLMRVLQTKTKAKFDWVSVLQLLIAERINEPSSKLQAYNHKGEYLGFKQDDIALQHFYRTLDVLQKGQEAIKKHLFVQQQNLFTQKLDVVFYDVTTLYFDSQRELEDDLRQKGYSKDGKAHKTQVVLGLLVDKMRNPITYQIYKGNTYEGATMVDAVSKLKEQYTIDRCIVIADSAMIDKENRAFMVENELDYIIGDRIKNLPKVIKEYLLEKANHKAVLKNIPKEQYSFADIDYQDRRIICTFSEKRAKKDAYQREKLLMKARKWIENPSQYKQVKKRGAGRYIQIDNDGLPKQLDEERIKKDAKYDGYKAVATTTELSAEEIIENYGNLFNVEHAFRTLKSQLRIRPIFHWTDKRIEGHIAMSFMAYTFLNYLRNATQMQHRELVRTLDQMQMSEIKEDDTEELIYMRSKVDEKQQQLISSIKIAVPNDITPQHAVNQLFI